MFAAERVPYHQTNSFTKIVNGYLSGAEDLRHFYAFPPTVGGITSAIEKKKSQALDRGLLVRELKNQYNVVRVNPQVVKNIELLNSTHTFTICTAHQPNLFTGPLYFMYKIIHAIRLADFLKKSLPQYDFVPVYYMGCEDADFDELNHTFINGKKLEWNKQQTGAVGRMKVDQELLHLIDEMDAQLYLFPHGAEVTALLKRCYAEGREIQSATFELINELFGRFGLVVLIPDNTALKQKMLHVFEQDIFHQSSSSLVAKTSSRLETHYKVQAHPREINLFYLEGNIRERIVKTGDQYKIHNTSLSFSEEELKKELNKHPERFSPNVILRGLFQETILPNVVFIGGGGELAYWLQLKDLFDHYSVPFPVQVLRNSFLIIQPEQDTLLNKIGIECKDVFSTELEMMNRVLEQQQKKPTLNGELHEIQAIYERLQQTAANVDSTLLQHVAALKQRSVKQLYELEKKMVRSERKKHEAVMNRISRVKKELFPNNNLQERVENFSSFYARWGHEFMDSIYQNSLTLEQEFVIIKLAT
ncbi:MAG TPA: bacillithiol biosynthesis cysteine-adding enzyme BshC [Chitinophagaceae bacterium]|nr:bacillithiol biosynthesis cysteine-adding enzyme BshC [Chitinophagaceae bacterium]